MQMTIGPKSHDRESSIAIAAAARHPLREIDGMAQTFRYDRDQQICREGRSVDCWHRIVSGAARRVLPRSEGDRRTIDILTPGDYFGFFIPDDRGLVVEAAAADTVVSSYPRWCVDFLTEVDSTTAQSLRDLELEAISRIHSHLFLGRGMSAAANIGCFLLDMANRLARDRRGWFELPTSLDEIADCLALTPGTVSCCLLLLTAGGVIGRDGGGRIRILDRDALRDGEIAPWPAERAVRPCASERREHCDEAPFFRSMQFGEPSPGDPERSLQQLSQANSPSRSRAARRSSVANPSTN